MFNEGSMATFILFCKSIGHMHILRSGIHAVGVAGYPIAQMILNLWVAELFSPGSSRLFLDDDF